MLAIDHDRARVEVPKERHREVNMTMNTDRIGGEFFSHSRRTATGSSLWSIATGALDSVATTMFAWLERARQRRELFGLSDRELHDFGVSRCDATSERSKPFWRP
jgi:uncharacterized protein YjiS (DUF1127 family)